MVSGITSELADTWQLASGSMVGGVMLTALADMSIRHHGSRIAQAGGMEIHQAGMHRAHGRRSITSGTISVLMDIWLQASMSMAIG